MGQAGGKSPQHLAGLGVQRGNLDGRAGRAFLGRGVFLAAMKNPKIVLSEHGAGLACVIHSGRKILLPCKSSRLRGEDVKPIAGVVIV